MSKAAQIAKQLEQLNVTEGMKIIDACNQEALSFDVIENSMCIMHKDGSVNLIENMGSGVITTEVISSENILKILHHYRPFKELFKGNTQ